MAEVERLLTAALVEVDVVDPARPDAQFCLRAYFDELGRRFDAGFDPASASPPAPTSCARPPVLFLRGHARGEPVGCGALKLHGDEPAELKRMWVADAGARARARPAPARRARARWRRRAARRSSGWRRTGRSREAIGLYRSAGYREVAAFNDEPYAHHWFEKRLRRPERQTRERG